MTTVTSLTITTPSELEAFTGLSLHIAIDNVVGAPVRFLNGYAYGKRVIAPLHAHGRLRAKLEGFLNGAAAVFNPASRRNRVGADARKHPSYYR